MTRKPWVGGNWKCNGTAESIEKLCAMLKADVSGCLAKTDVRVFPSPVHTGLVAAALPKEMIGSQNVSQTGNGAFTGETSVEMLQDLGINCTLVGHSERRTRYGDSDEAVAAKVENCQKHGFPTVICIGEQLAERKANETVAVLKKQMDAVIPKVTDWTKVVIAYEPVWAIGTGEVASKEQAQDAHLAVRGMLEAAVGDEVANAVRIVYGGSVTDENCSALIAQPDVDGFLVGGASLKPGFVKIVQSTCC